MKNILTNLKLDINTAVNYAAKEIHLGARGFFLNTQFGYIPIEVVNAKPVIGGSYTLSWKNAPATEWVLRNRQGDYKWYVSINYTNGQDMILTKMQILHELCYIIYSSIKATAPTEEELMVLMDSYMQSYEKYNTDMSADTFIKEYVRSNFSGKIQFGSATASMRQEVKRGIDLQKNMIMILHREYDTRTTGTFLGSGLIGDRFYDMLFTMCSYSLKDDVEKINAFLASGSPDESINAYDIIAMFIGK